MTWISTSVAQPSLSICFCDTWHAMDSTLHYRANITSFSGITMNEVMAQRMRRWLSSARQLFGQSPKETMSISTYITYVWCDLPTGQWFQRIWRSDLIDGRNPSQATQPVECKVLPFHSGEWTCNCVGRS